MEQQNENTIFTKRMERLASFDRLVAQVAADMKEMKYQAGQYEAKVQTLERQIMNKKDEVAQLDETIRRKKIDAAGSFNNLRDDLSRREQAVVKRNAELDIREANVKARAHDAEMLIVKAEKAIGPKASQPAPTPLPPAVEEANAPDASLAPVAAVSKRGPGRPKKEAVNA